ncbi:MAG: hypothetical protein FD168_222 [Desulfobulbaceae bacterium]|nr:MAG: hypothetical protein FD168_222 [Desulfobulbaceae bacterium]
MNNHADVPAIHLPDYLAGELGGGMDSDLVIDAENPAHHLRDKAEVMGDGEHGDPVGQLFEDLEKLEMGGRVDIGGGFIEEQDLRFTDQGPGNENALALTAGQAVEGAIGQIIHRQFGHGLMGDAPVFGAIPPQAHGAGPSHEHHIHDRYRKGGVVLKMLGHVADLGPRQVRGGPQYPDGAALGGEQSQDQFEQG